MNTFSSGRCGCLKDRYLEHFRWNWAQFNATIPHRWLVNIGWGNGLVPTGNKPSPEPVLTRSMLPSGVTRPQWFNSSCCTNFAIYMMVSCYGNAFLIVGPLWGDSLHNGPGMQSFNVSFIVNLEQIAELLVIRDIMMLMWNHCNEITFIVLNPVNNLLRGSWWNWLCINHCTWAAEYSLYVFSYLNFFRP